MLYWGSGPFKKRYLQLSWSMKLHLVWVTVQRSLGEHLHHLKNSNLLIEWVFSPLLCMDLKKLSPVTEYIIQRYVYVFSVQQHLHVNRSALLGSEVKYLQKFQILVLTFLKRDALGARDLPASISKCLMIIVILFQYYYKVLNLNALMKHCGVHHCWDLLRASVEKEEMCYFVI